jgi:SWI/SNF-related matrix-associated actin-dependent regulator of chromatin subfamily A member 5
VSVHNTASSCTTQRFVHGKRRRLARRTGTPLQNNLGELWALLHWLYPQIWTDATQLPFTNAFNLARGNVDPRFLAASQRLLELIMLRRTKEGVKGELTVPPRKEMTRAHVILAFQGR